jgi:hypothetical protein
MSWEMAHVLYVWLTVKDPKDVPRVLPLVTREPHTCSPVE